MPELLRRLSAWTPKGDRRRGSVQVAADLLDDRCQDMPRTRIKAGKVLPSDAHAQPDIRFPVEIWEEILSYMEDRTQLVRVALVCRSLRSVAEEMLSRRFVKLVTTQSIVSFCDAVTTSRRFANTVFSLEMHVRHHPGEAFAQKLVAAMKSLHHLQKLVLLVLDDRFAHECVQEGILDARFPTLTLFQTFFSDSPELLRFLEYHVTITDLVLPYAAHRHERDSESKVPVPNLRRLTCDAALLPSFSPSKTLTDLFLPLCTLDQLERVASTLGKQLRRLHFGGAALMAQQVRGERSWPFQSVLSRFPQLEYLEVCQRLDGEETSGIDFLAPGVPPFRFKRTSTLTVAWMIFDETHLEHNEQMRSYVRKAFDESALQVLRNWAPYVGQILYGWNARAITAVRLSPDQAALTHRALIEETNAHDVAL
ncbi:hypothetical protein OH77DRAFT_1077187 [Trametes cingulata]|nr:hypothetical protein OH77DRAFT_1077187 [Trametes cingulata]